MLLPRARENKFARSTANGGADDRSSDSLSRKVLSFSFRCCSSQEEGWRPLPLPVLEATQSPVRTGSGKSTSCPPSTSVRKETKKRKEKQTEIYKRKKLDRNKIVFCRKERRNGKMASRHEVCWCLKGRTNKQRIGKRQTNKDCVWYVDLVSYFISPPKSRTQNMTRYVCQSELMKFSKIKTSTKISFAFNKWFTVHFKISKSRK